MNSDKSHYKGLRYIKSRDVIENTIEQVAKERSGKQFGVKCRYDGINKAMLRWFRFGRVAMLSGMSGSGKSYLLNKLRQDFLSKETINFGKANFYLGDENKKLDLTFDINGKYKVPRTEDYDKVGELYLESGLIKSLNGDIIQQGRNTDCEYDVVLAHFGYEMPPEDEQLRTCSDIMGKSYGFLMSSEWDKDLRDYNKLSDKDFNEVSSVLRSFANQQEYYVPFSGDVEEFKATCYEIAKRNPNKKLIITLDHTLLSKRLKEKNDSELQTSIALAVVELRQKLDAFIILLNQMNQNIESNERIINPDSHYPGKKDIHLGAQIWWACDIVMMMHRPIVLGITKYGPNRLNTDHLIHVNIIKNRQGVIGDVFLKEDFSHVRIHYAKMKDFL
jgi:replicative DNA helicase